MSRRLVVLVPAVVLLVGVAPAQARLPSPAARTVVLTKSIGGVKLGMSLAAAKKAWGAGGTCAPASFPAGATQCTWSTTPKAKPDLGARLFFVVSKKQVVRITVADGTGGAKAGIAKYRTAKGIGVGASIAKVRKAYPALGSLDGTPDAASAELGTGKTLTGFFFVDGKLDSLTVGG